MIPVKGILSPILASTLFLLLGACQSGTDQASPGAPAASPAPVARIATTPKPSYEIPVANWAWDVEAGDPSVPADLGGPGFTGVGWETRNSAPRLGSPDAIRGGTVRQYLADWPATLRQAGENWNTSFNYAASGLCYESLLGMDPFTLKPTPGLATHWWISEDKTTYRFRINPKARFSNGDEVTADDVVASWVLRMDPGLRDPSSLMTYGKLHKPVAVSKYIVEVGVKAESWRNFLYFSGMTIFPASVIGNLTGEEYLDRYQFDYVPGSGPYIVKKEDIVDGQSITITRRNDYWNEDAPALEGRFNIDRFVYTIVKDPRLAFEKFKKGELDVYTVAKAQWWVEEVPTIDGVKRGLIQPRKFFNDHPIGTSGVAINMSQAPLDDLDIRRALQHLYNRELMIEKLFYGEYSPLESYYQGSVYQNPNNPPMPYDPVRAVELLEKAGWTETNEAGYRMKDGQQLRFTLGYASPLLEPSLTILQEDARAAGVGIDLQLLTPPAAWKALQEKKFQLMSVAWGALIFPNPETSFSGRLADETGNNNVTAFRNARVDELCQEYDREYDVERRIAIVQEIDGLVYAQQPYVLGWFLDPIRVLYWNKFGMPPWGIGPLADGVGEESLWWVDPERESELTKARSDPSRAMTILPVDNRYWQEWRQHQDAGLD